MEEIELATFDILKQEDKKLAELATAWRQGIEEKGGLETKYKEMILTALCCGRLFSFGAETHAKKAIEAGASREELFSAILQCFLVSGIPAFRTGAVVFKKLFPDSLE